MKIGFIGLGIMGKPMARHLIEDGFETYLFDINRAAVNDLATLGGQASESIEELAKACDIIFTMLPAAAHVAEVLFGENGISAKANPGTIVVDMSSVSVSDAKSFAERLKANDIFFLDAPVSGGEPMAISGKLSIMVGGDEEPFQRVLPLFHSMGDSIVHVGETGAGQVAKLANQIVVSINLAAVSEAAVFASKAGIDLNKVFAAIRGGLAGSAVLEAKMPKIINRDFEPGGRIEINFKDLNNVQETANSLGVPLPVTHLVKEIFSAEIASGFAKKDHSYIIDFFERMANHQTPKGGKQ
ncbi:2-hydroxy-3-oxopropionate reductase [Alicyclobacillus sp. SO9]|uniref:2-hydroxy-3-oxopropionate reductase n=1 Tax=Alicyclobacillus sp. SO9 TaxID=2665646 RepID=UPI0018E75A7C|nr:2-hydroxy-3-oxopropionate reductase [Alicyclobacillus sp. SO9]QQE80630.1 2-hydroxy-3-oxopropionate reductase [Alicyclobacillus sp. SO9]